MTVFINSKKKFKHWLDGRRGGYVMPMPDYTAKDLQGDSVPTILMPTELVIPTKHVHLVETFLREKGITFGNFK